MEESNSSHAAEMVKTLLWCEVLEKKGYRITDYPLDLPDPNALSYIKEMWRWLPASEKPNYWQLYATSGAKIFVNHIE